MNQRLILITLLFCLCGCIFAQTNALSAHESENVNQLMDEELLFQEVMGMAIGIVIDGKIVYTKGYGHQNLNRTVSVTSESVFNWASISKTLTAVAAFQLIEDNTLELNTTAKSVLNGIWTNSEDSNGITVGHLLSHRSGIRHYNNDRAGDIQANFDAYEDRDASSHWNSRQSVAIFNDLKLKSNPNEAYRYSTFGYNLLGAMIDNVSDDFTYEDHITKRILEPIGARSINVARSSWKAFSKNCHGAVRNWKEDEKRPVLPGGGWQSNIEDLTKFMQGLINEAFLKNTSALWDEVIADGSTVPNNRYRYGLRYELDLLNDEVIVSHSGKHENVRTMMAFFPKSKLGFCVLINGGYGSANRVFRKLATAFGKTQMVNASPLMTWEYINGCDNDITGFWNNGAETSLVRFGYNQNRFAAENANLESKGYHLVDCEYFERDDELLMSGIFKKEGNPTKYISPKIYSSFNKIVNRLEANRYKLTDIEVFRKDNQVMWSGIASKQINNPVIVRDLDIDAFKAKIANLKNEGQFLIDLESYQSKGGLKWAGLFRTGSNFDVKFLKTKSDFAEIRIQLGQSHYILKDLEIIDLNGELLYSGVFHPNKTMTDFKPERTHTQISILNNTKVSNSLKLIDIEKPFRKN